MVLSLDELASRYHCLPSEALNTADTFDLFVMNTAAKWAKKVNEKSNSTPTAPMKHPGRKLTDEEMESLDKFAQSKRKK